MSTLWADGFEDQTMANLSASYTILNAYTSVAGRRPGTYAIRSANNATRAKKQLGAAVGTVFFSFAINLEALPVASAIVRLYSGSTVQASLGISEAGALTAYRSDSTLLSLPVYTLPIRNWLWLQVKVVISDTVGSFEVRDASGAVLAVLTGQDTKASTVNSTVDAFELGGLGAAYSIDDLHIWSDAGSICNTFTNDTRIDSLYPSAAGDKTQFTPSTAPNWDCVNEANASSTDSVSSDVAGHQDLYQLTNLTHTPVTVFGIVRTAFADKDDAGARSVKLLTKSGATLQAGSAGTLTLGSNVRLSDVQETDPATAAAWTPAGVSAMQGGVEVV